jgi:hypothetical protein
MFFIERMNGDNWQKISGPYGTEQVAYIQAKHLVKTHKRVRITTKKGSVVNIL